MSEFSLIRGVGIFPTQDLGPIMPSMEDRITFDIVPPNRSNEEFKIVITHQTELVLGFSLKSSNSSSKGLAKKVKSLNCFMTKIVLGQWNLCGNLLNQN